MTLRHFPMTEEKAMAHSILDDVLNGIEHTQTDIRWALLRTGDLTTPEADHED